MTIEPDDLTLPQELAQLEGELAKLNLRRVDLYKRSLEADPEDKACADLVASAMLGGPLADANRIDWPVELNGIAWTEDNHACYAAAAMWVRVKPMGAEREYLGLHLGDVATAVLAQLGDGSVLHLTHAQHSPVLYVPELPGIVSGLEASWKPLEDAAELETVAPAGEIAPRTAAWAAQALVDLSGGEPDSGPH